MSRLGHYLIFFIAAVGVATARAEGGRIVRASDLSPQEQAAVWHLISQIYEQTRVLGNIERTIAASGEKGRYVPIGIVYPGIPESREQEVLSAITKTANRLSYRIPSRMEAIRIAKFKVTIKQHEVAGSTVELEPELLVLERSSESSGATNDTHGSAAVLKHYILQAGYLCERVSSVRETKKTISQAEANLRVSCDSGAVFEISILPKTVMVEPENSTARRREQ